MASSVLSTIPEIDALWAEHSGNITRSGNVNILPGDGSSGGAGNIICHIPFVAGVLRGGALPRPGLRIFEAVAATMMAIQHLNTGDGSIVPEVAGLDEKCPIRFSTEVLDTEWSPKVGVAKIIELTTRDNTEPQPCAIVGAWLSSVTLPTSIVSGLSGYPQISPSATSVDLDDKTLYPLFMRTTASSAGDALLVVQYFRNTLNVKNLGVVQQNDAYGQAYGKAFQEAVKLVDPSMRVFVIDIPADPSAEDVARVVASLKESQLQYFFGILLTPPMQAIYPVAVEEGIADTGTHEWFWSNPGGSDVPKGTGTFTSVGGLPGISTYDKFAAAVKSLKNDQNLDILASKMPTYERFSPEETNALFDPALSDEDFLEDIAKLSMFAYDAVITAGLGACKVSSAAPNGELTGELLFSAMKNVSFAGATGPSLQFDGTTGTRLPETQYFSLQNYIPANENGEYDANGANVVGRVSQFYDGNEWTELEPYIFSDGTSTPPPDLPSLEVDHNYYHTAALVFGFLFAAVGILLALSFAGWTYKCRTSFVVKVSQPVFLLLICSGCLVLASSIIPLGMDPSIVSIEGASRACIAFPWLLSIGLSVTFCALHCKTRRVLQVMKAAQSMRRVTITASQVIPMLILFVGANVVVLIVWTAVDPLEWHTDVVEVDFFGRSIETRGYCRSVNSESEDDFRNWIYWVFLAVINVGSILIAFFSAYKAKDMDDKLAESRSIFFALGVLVIASFVGIPVLIIANENSTAFYFVFSAIIFLIVCSVLGFMFVPKIIRWRKGDDERISVTRSSTHQARGSVLSASGSVRVSGIATSVRVPGIATSDRSGSEGAGARLSGVERQQSESNEEEKVAALENGSSLKEQSTGDV